MFEAHPEWHEGELTRVRARLVSRKHIAEVAISIGLGRHLRLSRGEERVGLRNKSTVLSNSMEAVLGAMFLDGGLEPVRAFARKYVIGEAAEQLAQELRSGAPLGNYKSALQEHMQAEGTGIPVYKVKSESGPDHRKRFLVEVRLKSESGEPGQPLARGMGSTKKYAEQDAARRALERLTAGEIRLAAKPCRTREEQAARMSTPRTRAEPAGAAGRASFAASLAHGAGGLVLAAANGGGGAVSAHIFSAALPDSFGKHGAHLAGGGFPAGEQAGVCAWRNCQPVVAALSSC